MEMNEIEKELREYEISFTGPTETVLPAVEAVLTAHSAEIVSRLPAKQVSLAYPIKKHRAAVFGSIRFRGLPAEIAPLEQELLLKPDVLRFLIVTLPVHAGSAKKSTVVKELQVSPVAPLKPVEPRSPKEALTNEALEQKLEEILQ